MSVSGDVFAAIGFRICGFLIAARSLQIVPDQWCGGQLNDKTVGESGDG